MRELDDDEGKRLVRIIRRGTGSVVTWRRAQMILLSAQNMPVPKIAEVAFTSADRVRDVIHNFNTDGFDSLYPKYSGGRPKKFTLPERREIKKIAKSVPTEHDLPFSTWSLTTLAEFLVAEGVVDDISHEGLRVLLREEGVSFQKVKTWKRSKDSECAAKKARVEHLYAIADGEVVPDPDEPQVIFCLDGFGPRTCSRIRAGSGTSAVASTRTRTGNRGAGGGRPIPARTECGICSPRTTWARTSSTGTSRPRRTAPRSSNSAATCAPCAQPRSVSRSCATTSHPT